MKRRKLLVYSFDYDDEQIDDPAEWIGVVIEQELGTPPRDDLFYDFVLIADTEVVGVDVTTPVTSSGSTDNEFTLNPHALRSQEENPI